MGKRTIATNFDVSKDATGGLVNLNYTCPYCHYENYELIFIGAANMDKLDNDFETDQVCKICGRDVIIECR
ncbi:hypothetical protein ACIQXV_14255 [Neobacillus sp. NPDC097160]|uniref:hypothetical protein n=1 Tax=Neobacillus sp. NPDC097160 TaxID=3364298 RepID=UPI00380F9632